MIKIQHRASVALFFLKAFLTTLNFRFGFEDLESQQNLHDVH